VSTPAQVLSLLRSPIGQKLFRYSMASVVAVMVSTACLIIFVGPLHLSAVVGSTLATSIAAVPSYWMNRRWAWGKSGRSHLFKEVLPFWALALIGWGCSTAAVKLMESYAKSHGFGHTLTTITVAIAYVGAFGVLWVVKFIIFNKVMFVHHPREDDEPVLDRAA
jgi:putative flippase GtrA